MKKKKVQVTIIEKNIEKIVDASVEVIGITKWKTTEPKTAKLRTSEPKTTKPRTSEPKTTKPRTSEPKTTKPRTSERKPLEPQTTQTRYRKDEKNLGSKNTGATTK